MKKEIYNATRSLLLDYYNDRAATDPERLQELRRDIEAGASPQDATLYQKAIRGVENGLFAAYYDQAEADLAAIFGKNYDKSRYYTKSGGLKYRGGQAYLWRIYAAMIATATVKALEEA